MESSSKYAVRKTSVCQTCGDKGEVLIYCMQCQDSAVHQYCLDKFSPDDDNISWMCEHCSPKLPKVGPSRKSDRISLRRHRAVEVRNNWKKRLNKNCSSSARINLLPEYTCISGGGSVSVEEEKKHVSVDDISEKISLPVEGEKKQLSDDDISGISESRRKRWLKLEGGDISAEESEVVKTDVPQSTPSGNCSPSNISYYLRSVEPDNPFCTQPQPAIDPIWRGRFRITYGKKDTFVELMGYLSSKSCPEPEVCAVANALPAVLNVEILPKRDVWPKRFQKLPPTENNIALYFLPVSERDEKICECLIDEIIEQNLALKVLIRAVELLVFSSRELPQQHWRFRRKYYLWGAFRQHRHSLVNVASETLIVPEKNGATHTFCM